MKRGRMDTEKVLDQEKVSEQERMEKIEAEPPPESDGKGQSKPRTGQHRKPDQG